MASEEMTLVMRKRPAKPTEAVDLPTPVAPAMSNNRGGRAVMAWAALWANPMRWAMAVVTVDTP
jgi:hypothetical protein